MIKLPTSRTLGALLVVPALCSATGSESEKPADRRPDIIIINADDLGWGDLGSYGHPSIRTPNLDRMAAEGVRLTDFYCASPICSPSRAGLLTGRSPQRTGLYGHLANGVVFPNSPAGFPASETTVAELLREVGYRTVLVGKWHLGHSADHLPTAHGFDDWFGLPYSNDMSNPTRGEPPLPLIDNRKVVASPIPQEEIGRRLTDRVLEELKGPSDRPLFILFQPTAPHTPVVPENPGRSARGKYGDVVEELDAQVGQVLDALRERKRPALVFFTSDNGPWTFRRLDGGSSGPLRGGKVSCWEGGMRVPGIAWWPGVIPAGRVLSGPASQLDLMPTCVELAGAKLPDVELDGYSLVSYLRGESQSPRDTVWYHWESRLVGVREGNWKLVVDPEHIQRWVAETSVELPRHRTGGEHTPPPIPRALEDIQNAVVPEALLFNVGVDPGETVNVAQENPEVTARLLQLTKNPPFAVAASLFDVPRLDPEATKASFEYLDWSAVKR